MNAKIEITNDVFDISKRIKEIDDGYFVMYDLKLNRYEIHHRRQRPHTLSLVLPYDTLDCRALDRVLTTRTEYIAERLSEMEEHNRKLSCAARPSAENRLELRQAFRRFPK